MKKDRLLRNADFLSIAMEEMDSDSVAFEFVEDVYADLIEEAESK